MADKPLYEIYPNQAALVIMPFVIMLPIVLAFVFLSTGHTDIAIGMLVIFLFSFPAIFFYPSSKKPLHQFFDNYALIAEKRIPKSQIEKIDFIGFNASIHVKGEDRPTSPLKKKLFHFFDIPETTHAINLKNMQNKRPELISFLEEWLGQDKIHTIK